MYSMDVGQFPFAASGFFLHSLALPATKALPSPGSTVIDVPFAPSTCTTPIAVFRPFKETYADHGIIVQIKVQAGTGIHVIRGAFGMGQAYLRKTLIRHGISILVRNEGRCIGLAQAPSCKLQATSSTKLVACG
jgi:hypothetical protein